MSSRSNDQGRAYEYICLLCLQDEISVIRPSEVIHNSSYYAAERAWNTLSGAEKTLYKLSAKSIINTIFALEPNIVEVDDDILHLYIQDDQHGMEVDVRDIIIKRKDIVWEIGLSIKHNHMAVKHSRLAKTLDFGKKWYDVECSQSYWHDVNPVFAFLEVEKNKGTYFCDLDSKEDDVYMPLLNAFMHEIRRQVDEDNTIPRRMVEYLLSKYDFYKVISLDSKRLTTVQSFNIYGTLNLSSKTASPKIHIPKMELPTTLLYIGFKPKSKNTVIMSFDNGWQFSFRIHNASKKIETSLKFDIQIEGMPADVNIKFNCNW